MDRRNVLMACVILASAACQEVPHYSRTDLLGYDVPQSRSNSLDGDEEREPWHVQGDMKRAAHSIPILHMLGAGMVQGKRADPMDDALMSGVDPSYWGDDVNEFYFQKRPSDDRADAYPLTYPDELFNRNSDTDPQSKYSNNLADFKYFLEEFNSEPSVDDVMFTDQHFYKRHQFMGDMGVPVAYKKRSSVPLLHQLPGKRGYPAWMSRGNAPLLHNLKKRPTSSSTINRE